MNPQLAHMARVSFRNPQDRTFAIGLHVITTASRATVEHVLAEVGCNLSQQHVSLNPSTHECQANIARREHMKKRIIWLLRP